MDNNLHKYVKEKLLFILFTFCLGQAFPSNEINTFKEIKQIKDIFLNSGEQWCRLPNMRVSGKTAHSLLLLISPPAQY